MEEIPLKEVRGSRLIIEESKLSAVLSLNDFKILRKGDSIARRTWKDMPNKNYHTHSGIKLLFTETFSFANKKVQGQISAHIFAAKLRLLCLLSIAFKNWGISADIPQF